MQPLNRPETGAADTGAPRGLLRADPRLAGRAEAKAVLRRDPAPSRLSYRLQRLWLTPRFHTLLRVGLPLTLAVLAVGIFLSEPARRQAIADRVAELRRSIQERPEFMVTMMAVEGATPEVAGAVRDVVPVRYPISSFRLDLEAMRATIEALDAIARADLRIRPGGVLEATIEERIPAVVRRGRSGLDLLDTTGHRVAGLVSREGRADLPLIAGDGADAAVPEALAIFAAAGPVGSRLRGLVRVGERRWDMVLDREQRILLPEDDPVGAVERVIALDQAEDILARDLVTLDLRNGQRPTIRLAEGSLAELRRVKQNGAGVIGQ